MIRKALEMEFKHAEPHILRRIRNNTLYLLCGEYEGRCYYVTHESREGFQKWLRMQLLDLFCDSGLRCFIDNMRAIDCHGAVFFPKDDDRFSKKSVRLLAIHAEQITL